MNYIKEIRNRKNISMTELSKRTGLSRAALYNIEKGKSDPSLTSISLISRALKEKPEKIFHFYGNHELQKCK